MNIPQNIILWKVLFHLLLCVVVPTEYSFAQNHHYVILLKDKISGQPLAGATVISFNRAFSQTADSIGQLTIPPAIIEKDERLQISMVGYKTVNIAAKYLITLRGVELESDNVTLEEVIVSANNPVAKVRHAQMGTETINIIEARKLPAIFGEVDIIKILQLKPGVKTAGEGMAGFYVRGGGADQNLIMIDNAPVYNPNHLLGLFSIFNADAVREVKLYKAAYPAEYSGRLSSVLDVSMRPGSPDSFSVAGGIGFLSSRISIESPIEKGRSSFIISGRRTYFDIFTNALNRVKETDPDYEKIPSYYFSDLNLRADWKVNKNNSVWMTGYLGTDRFRSSSEDFSLRFNWGNRTASLNWISLVERKAKITSTIFYSNYQYQLENQFGFNDLVLRSGISTVGMKVTASTIATKALNWHVGIDGMFHKLNIGDFKASSGLSDFNSGEKLSGSEWGMFLNTEWNEEKKLALLGGVRLSGFYATDKWNLKLEPRLALRMAVGENSALKLSYTRMYQYLHLASLSSASLPTDIWYPSTDKTRPQFADQVSIGWSQAIKNNILFFSMEGYYKWMKNQVEFRDGANIVGNPKLENDFVYGKGNAYGIETYIEKKLGKTTGWIGYTLSWTTRTFAEINEGMAFKPRYDRRHDLSFVFIHRLNNKFMLSGNWIFGSGAYITVPVGRYVFQDQAGTQSHTIIPVYTKRSNYQLAPVHRLDLSLTMSLKSKKGTKDLTFTLYNAYSRRNPLYIKFRESTNKVDNITSIEPTLVSLFPVLPAITYNFKF